MQIFTNKSAFLCTALCSLLTLNSACFADSTITLNTESGDATLLVKNGRLSIKPNNPEDAVYIQNMTVSEAIFDSSEQTLYIIDHTQSTISPLTKANIEQFGSTLEAAAGVLDSMPEEHRGTLSGLMRDFGIDVPESDDTVEVRLNPLSEQQFRGITCQENSVLEDNHELGRICITQANSTPLSDSDYQTLSIAQEFFLLLGKQAQPFAEQYGHSMPNLAGIELPGLVVYSNQIQVDPNTPAASFVVTMIDSSGIADINRPAGYQTRPLLYNN